MRKCLPEKTVRVVYNVCVRDKEIKVDIFAWKDIFVCLWFMQGRGRRNRYVCMKSYVVYSVSVKRIIIINKKIKMFRKRMCGEILA